MALQINTVAELKELLGSTDISITDPEELRNLLETVNNAGTVDPEHRKAEQERQERQQQREHAERLRALELGLDPTQAKAQENSGVATAWAAGWIGTLVPLATILGATVTTVNLGHSGTLQLYPSAISMIWGAAAVISVAAIAVGIVCLRRSIPIATPPVQRTGSPSPRAENSSTAFVDSASSFRER